MKLSESNPEQHMAILVIGGVFIFINSLDTIKAYMRESGEEGGPSQRYTQSIDGATGAVTSTKTRYSNPQLSWYERLLCRGYQRSSNCNLRLLHPKTADADQYGIEVPEGAPENDHVVYFRGNINKNLSLSRTITSPEAETPGARVFAADKDAVEPAPNPDKPSDAAVTDLDSDEDE